MPDPALDPATATTRAMRRRPTMTWQPQVGDLLGGRYRLTSLVAAGSTELWKALDEVLARQVAVRIFSDGEAPAARRAAFVRAAVAAGQVVGNGVASVFDAATEPAAPREGEDPRQIGAPVSYVVAEWVEGESLATRLRGGALEPAQACSLVSDLCATVEAAHEQEVYAGRLHPGQVILTGAGRPKLTDLAVASIVHGQESPGGVDAAIREDTRGLARVLYAALTGYWPEPGWTEPFRDLAPAPLRDGRLCLPRQVKAGLPREVDLLIVRALEPSRRPNDPAITTPRQLSDALAGLRTSGERPLEAAEESPLSTKPAGGRRKRWFVIPFVGLLVVLAVAGWLAGLLIGRVPGTTVAAIKVPAVRATASGASAANPLVPANVTSFDPQGDKHEDEDQVPLATDGDTTTVWDTEQYNSATFGNLKTGVGLLVDLGSAQSISHVGISAPAGEQLELLADPGATSAPTSDKQATVAAGPVTAADGTTTLKPASPVSSRFFVVWITALPPSADPGASKNAYFGQIAEMSFYG